MAGAQFGSGNVQVNNYYYGSSAGPGTGGAKSAPTGSAGLGHVFLSYVREDAAAVDALQQALESAGVRVWRDTVNLWPGEDWRAKIREAITGDALVFIACFSSHSTARSKSYQNEELVVAIEQLRQRRPHDPWLIPVRFDDCEVPDFDLGAGRTLASVQRVDLFGAGRDPATGRLVAAVLRMLRQAAAGVPSPDPAPPRPSRDAHEPSAVAGHVCLVAERFRGAGGRAGWPAANLPGRFDSTPFGRLLR
jgi:hypothetical protein